MLVTERSTQVVPPQDMSQTQIGATKEVTPEKEEREAVWDTVTSPSQTGAPSGKEEDYRGPVDLQCKFIIGPEVCNLRRLPALENGAALHEYERRTPYRFTRRNSIWRGAG